MMRPNSLPVFADSSIEDGARTGSMDAASDPGVRQTSFELVNGCSTGVRYPTNQVDFTHLYERRAFYADGNHLGHDIAYAEGVPIHPIACGKIVAYRAARGYGTLVVVIEHHLSEPRLVMNGAGEEVLIQDFLSIYGHLRAIPNARSSALGWTVGATVSPDDVIGYIENAARNGDGQEHLHLGIRLQSKDAAVRTDPSAWFRGYDSRNMAIGSQRRFFADPARFLQEMMTDVSLTVRWHPAGTVIAVARDPDVRYLVDADDRLRRIDPSAAYSDRLSSRTIFVTDLEMSCYDRATGYQPFYQDVELVRFPDQSVVYEVHRGGDTSLYRFISYEAFSSWGWTDRDVYVASGGMVSRERAVFLSLHTDRGFRRLREGTLVRVRGQSEVAVVSNGSRLPFINWDTFAAMGYRVQDIVDMDASVVDANAGSRGALITPELARHCRFPNPCLLQNCHAGAIGGGGVEDPEAGAYDPEFIPPMMDMLDAASSSGSMTSLDAGISVRDVGSGADAPPVPDTGSSSSISPETCNGVDDDGDGQTDEIFICRLGTIGPLCVTRCGALGFRRCSLPRCDWGDECEVFRENCDDAIDNDCDGQVDCADTDCRAESVCTSRSLPDTSTMPAVDATTPPSDVVAVSDALISDAGAASTPDVVGHSDVVSAPVADAATSPSSPPYTPSSMHIVTRSPSGCSYTMYGSDGWPNRVDGSRTFTGVNWAGWIVMNQLVCGGVPRSFSASDEVVTTVNGLPRRNLLCCNPLAYGGGATLIFGVERDIDACPWTHSCPAH